MKATSATRQNRINVRGVSCHGFFERFSMRDKHTGRGVPAVERGTSSRNPMEPSALCFADKFVTADGLGGRHNRTDDFRIFCDRGQRRDAARSRSTGQFFLPVVHLIAAGRLGVTRWLRQTARHDG